MIIIKLQGGLGNQLFLYGLYKNLEHLGSDVKMDIESGFEGDELRIPCLKSMGLNYKVATMDEIIAIRDSYMDIFSRIRRKITGRKTFDYFEPEDGNFDPKVFEQTHAYLDGYFQSEKYFGDSDSCRNLKDELLKGKDRILSSSDTLKDLYKIMRDSSSVSLHIRRGDYLTPGIMETYGGICTDEYYDKAMNRIKDEYNDARFFIFSNDIDWCKEKYGSRDDVIFVENRDEHEGLTDVPDDQDNIKEHGNIKVQNDIKVYGDIKDYGNNSLRDVAELYLMSTCKHHILANSSFSWWGAWLSDHKGITIAPSKWLNNKNMTDIYTKDMLLI